MREIEKAFEPIDLFARQQMEIAGTPAMVLAVTDREGARLVAVHGFSDLAARVPAHAGTLFEIGSISKSFTAMALLQWREEGKLDLHAPVTHYLPWFHTRSRYAPITVHHLLCHTAGIINGTDFTTEACYESWALRDTEATTPPGTHFHYSNVSYKVLGLVLEAVAGQDYATVIQARVLAPLGMADTVPVITHAVRPRLAIGYEPVCDDRPAPPGGLLAPAPWFETGTADGSIASTASDMAAYLRLLLHRGAGPHGRLLSQESFRLLAGRAIALPQDEQERGAFYGYGLQSSEEEGHEVLSHSGGMVGYYSAMRADLDAGLGVVVLCNGPGEPEAIARTALRLLRSAARGDDLPPLPPPPDSTHVDDATGYTGTYRCEERAFDLVALGDRLIMAYRGIRLPLVQRGADRFYVPHPDFALFLLHVERAESRVIGAGHGAHFYVRNGASLPGIAGPSPDWLAYTGHYRCHNPWLNNLRVVQRRGKLLYVWPSGHEEPLVPLADGCFRVGADEHSPERLCFDTIVDGRAVRAILSGCAYYRTFTP
ncbi:MAG: beta-lactamase family protein [Anaerolineae bacterium]|nr:beta-lactamase family protein [Anaerolineae bacterium]